MPTFSERSLLRLATCDERLQRVMFEAIKHVDFSVLCGHRGEVEQTAAFRAGTTKVQYPNSKHNAYPSKAVDIVPYPVDWRDTRRFDYLAGHILGIAGQMGIKLRWGGDWNGNDDMSDQSFNDLPHFELVE
jgi:peptidoglycan L-alanyl-D-glutamate endopeptidase CwlK